MFSFVFEALQCCHSPVVGRVLEEVEDWHGRVGEAMDEDGFQQPLGVVERPAGQGDPEVDFC